MASRKLATDKKEKREDYIQEEAAVVALSFPTSGQKTQTSATQPTSSRSVLTWQSARGEE